MLVDILVVEDDERTNAAMLKLLSRMGHAPRSACTFSDAMVEVNRCAPQVLITDWDLGEFKSGIDIATTALALRANCKVVFCSGNSRSALMQRTQHLNVCRYIKKPVSMHQMRDEFKTVLDEL